MKTLTPTREAGAPVALWKVESPQAQAKAIANEMVRRHDEDGVPWHEMAVLFRCFKTVRGILHSLVQRELTSAHVPYCVVGGKSLFERRSVLTLTLTLALTLALTLTLTLTLKLQATPLELKRSMSVLSGSRPSSRGSSSKKAPASKATSSKAASKKPAESEVSDSDDEEETIGETINKDPIENMRRQLESAAARPCTDPDTGGGTHTRYAFLLRDPGWWLT